MPNSSSNSLLNSPANSLPTTIKLTLFWNSSKSQFRARLTTNDGSFNTQSGFLPKFPSELETALRSWREVYSELPQIRLKSKGVTHAPDSNAHQQAKVYLNQIKALLNTWLDGSDQDWQPIRETLIKASGQLGEQAHFLVEIEDQDEIGQLQPLSPLLRRLPWQEWNLFKHHFPHAEIVLRVEGSSGKLKPLPQLKPRILVVFGDNDGIDLTPDRQVIQVLQQQGAEVKLLEQPSHDELSEALRSDPGYHIFIFSGHSRSDSKGSIGWLELGANRSLEIHSDGFSRAFKQAVNQGLQLAIFNSCDGMGLANQMAKVGLPRSIVMREVVPNEVAASFLKYFFKEFAGKHHALVPAFHHAREQLEDCHYDSPYPGATWLPSLCLQDTVAAQSLFWQDLILQQPFSRFPGYLRLGILVLVLLGLGLSLGYWQLKSKSKEISKSVSSPLSNSKLSNSKPPIDQLISQGERLLISSNTNPAKDAGIRAYSTKNYGEAIQQFRQALKANVNDPETLIYLNNAIAEQKMATNTGKVFEIAISVPIKNEPNVSQEMLRGIAQAQTEQNCGQSSQQISQVLQANFNCLGQNSTFVKVTIGDDEYEPNVAEKIAESFVQNPNILGVIGHHSSDMTLRAGAIYEKHQLAAISSTSTSIRISNFNPYVFRTVPNDTIAAQSLKNHLESTLGMGTKVAAAYVPNNAYSDSLTQEFSRVSAQPFVHECDLSTSNFNAADCLTKAQQKGAKALLLVPATDRSLSEAILAITNNNGRLQLLAGDSVYSPKILQNSGQNAVAGTLTVAVPWHRSEQSKFAQQAEQFWQAAVSWRTATTYDATQALIHAINQCGNSCHRRQVQQILSSPDFSAEGATGTVEFEPSGDRKLTSDELSVLVQVKPRSTESLGTGTDYEFRRVEP
ncbi:MAG: ABC transporter substrate-binding protein [Microcoleaceae cyanobacterium]